MMNYDAISTIDDLSGSTMKGAKQIAILANDLLCKFDQTNDEETILRLELIASISEQILTMQEEIQETTLSEIA